MRARARVCVCVRACVRTCVREFIYIYGREVLYILAILKGSRLAVCVCERERVWGGGGGGFDPRTPFDVFCTFI